MSEKLKNRKLIMVDEATKKTIASIPLLRTNASPRDGDQWATRLKEEYMSLIKVRMYLPWPLALHNSIQTLYETRRY